MLELIKNNTMTVSTPLVFSVRKFQKTNHNKKNSRSLIVSYKKILKNNKIKKQIMDLRDELELVWCDETRYHGTIFNETDKISKGQCGVSSFYLAKFLEQKHFEVLFCEGDAYFPSSSPILKHCWVKLLGYTAPEDELIIDITADQSGYEHKVVCMTKSELNKSGIFYKTKKECQTREIQARSLLKRQAKLEIKMKKLMEGEK